MIQCRFLKNDGNQCTRKVKVGKLCWQHSLDKKGLGLLAFIGLILGLWWTGSNIYKRDLKPKLEEWEVIDIVCDRDSDLGCNIDLKLCESNLHSGPPTKENIFFTGTPFKFDGKNIFFIQTTIRLK